MDYIKVAIDHPFYRPISMTLPHWKVTVVNEEELQRLYKLIRILRRQDEAMNE